MEKGYRVITFNAVLPLELVGFIAEISTKLASKGVSILAYSSFSTDHILVKENNLKKTLKTLKELGCIVEE